MTRARNRTRRLFTLSGGWLFFVVFTFSTMPSPAYGIVGLVNVAGAGGNVVVDNDLVLEDDEAEESQNDFAIPLEDLDIEVVDDLEVEGRVFVVTNTGDDMSGPPMGSLRAVLKELNDWFEVGHRGPFRIVFDLSETDKGFNRHGEGFYWRIFLKGPLSLGGVTIDGRTAGTSPDGNPTVVIDGTLMKSTSRLPIGPLVPLTGPTLFDVGRGNTEIYGLAFVNSPGHGVTLNSHGYFSHHVIQGCWFGGLLPGSSEVEGNRKNAVHVLFSTNVTIGGTEPGEGNLIVGSGWSGISNVPEPVLVLDSPVESPLREMEQELTIVGNQIGTDSERGLPNHRSGVLVIGATRTVISHNQIHSESTCIRLEEAYQAAVNQNVLGLDILAAKPQFGVVAVEGREITVKENPTIIRDTGVLIHGFREVSISGNRVSAALDLTEQEEDPTVGMDILRCGEALIGDDEDIEAGANVVVGLTTGIRLRLDDAKVVGNFVGTERDGRTPNGNRVGISIEESQYAIIANNVVSANAVGLSIDDSKGIFCIGNAIGTDRAGEEALGNDVGVAVSKSFEVSFRDYLQEEAAGFNVISGNRLSGVVCLDSEKISFVGNFIGTDRTGRRAIPNGAHGILIQGSRTISIGGDDYGNVISGNERSGVLIDTSSSAFIVYNRIGTDVTGMEPLPNGADGVTVISSDAVKILSNVLSANRGNGAQVIASIDTVFQLNGIGVGYDEETALGNGKHGIYLGAQTIESYIKYNTIAHNARAGVFFDDGVGMYNDLVENSFYENRGGAITFEGAGPNDRQRPPEILRTEYLEGVEDLFVTYRVEAGDGASKVLVEFYLSDGTGGGKDYLGSHELDGEGGVAVAQLPTPREETAGRSLVAIARATVGNHTNASGFSTEVSLSGESQAVFKRGDVNSDGRLDVTDARVTLEWLFTGAAKISDCLAAADVNGSGVVDIGDPTYSLFYLFAGGAPPVAPFERCGLVTRDEDVELGCNETTAGCR